MAAAAEPVPRASGWLRALSPQGSRTGDPRALLRAQQQALLQTPRSALDELGALVPAGAPPKARAAARAFLAAVGTALGGELPAAEQAAAAAAAWAELAPAARSEAAAPQMGAPQTAAGRRKAEAAARGRLEAALGQPVATDQMGAVLAAAAALGEWATAGGAAGGGSPAPAAAEFGADLGFVPPNPFRFEPAAAAAAEPAGAPGGDEGAAAAAAAATKASLVRAMQARPGDPAGDGPAAAGAEMTTREAGRGGSREADLEQMLWFYGQCAALVAAGAPFQQSNDVALTVVGMLLDGGGPGGGERLGLALFELLGDAGLEFISGLVERRAAFLDALHRAVRRAQAAQQRQHQRPPDETLAVVHGQVVSVQSEGDRAAKRLRQKEARRLKKVAGLDAVQWLEAHGFDLLLEWAAEGEGGEGGPAGARRPEYDTAALDAIVGTGDRAPRHAGLSKNAVRRTFPGYEEVFVPASPPGAAAAGERRVPIAELDDWAQQAFPGYEALNRIQSRIFEAAYYSNENILVCAPTGAGKTNIAMLTLLHEVKQNIQDGRLDKAAFKVVYVAPMKALAAEVTATFSRRLAPLNLAVRELTGDMQLSKKELQETQMIVTTPEKWDVVTRKGGDVSAAALLRLLIIDEVHLLNDERGAVIEALVARTKRQVEARQSMIRIVGLSATLPTYKDVGAFLGVNERTGLFHFDALFRPVPLDQTYIGVSERNFAQRARLMNEICFRKVVESLEAGHQAMVFVHARKETVRTGLALAELARAQGLEHLFDCSGDPKYELHLKDVGRSKNRELQQLFQSGVGTHHAGMLRADRSLTERLFSKGLLKVLVCTATLAWGVNLPAHTVIIKGTQFYDPEKGSFVEVSILDVMQIFGRAGRPQFDTRGEAFIITAYDQLGRYLALMQHQAPIESSFARQLVDNLNAELVLGTVTNVREACVWLSYTYLHVRMLRNPLAYGLPWNALDGDPALAQHRKELITTAARRLAECRMAVFDEKSGNLYVTEMGRVASHYNIEHGSIETYNERLKPHMSRADLFEMLSLSAEFANVRVRDDEVPELEKLQRRCCEVDVRGGLESAHGKANLLMQCYISRARPGSFSLVMDMAYMGDNCPRIARALFEICLRRGWSSLTEMLLTLCKSLEKQLWPHAHPLFQLPKLVKPDVVQRLEDRGASYDRLYDMSAAEIGALLRLPHAGGPIKAAVEAVPAVDLEASLHPITRSVLRVVLKVTPCFRWKEAVHGRSVRWVVWVEDQSNEHIYHSETWVLEQKMLKDAPFRLAFTVPVFEPLPPQYYVRLVAEHWLGAEAWVSLELNDLILPERHPPHTELLDLAPLPRAALRNPAFEALYEGRFSHFNPVQTQAFHVLYHTDNNVLLGAPTGSGKTVCSELAVLRAFASRPEQKVVYIAPLKALVRERIKDWGGPKGLCRRLGKRLVELTGDHTPDLQALRAADLIVATPEKWDGVSRSWKDRAYARHVSLLVIDEIHLLGQDRGPILEVIVSRMNHIAQQTGHPVRVVGLSTALANARDLADWLNIPRDENGHGIGLYNFRPSVRPVPLECHIQGYPGKFYCPRMAAMNKPAYAAIRTHSPSKPVLVFVSSRRQTRLTALDLIAHAAADERPAQFVHLPEATLEAELRSVRDPALQHTLQFGIGLHHAGLSEGDREVVERLFGARQIQVLVATSTLAWGVNTPAHLVIIKGTEYFDAPSRSYVDFPITDVLQMMGRAGRPQFDKTGCAVIMVHEPKKAFYKKFLYEPFPVESQLPGALAEHLNAEVAAGTVRSKQGAVDWLTWTYFFRRLVRNPSYYELSGTSHDEINRFLSELVEAVLGELEEAGCVECWDDDGGEAGDRVEPLPLGRLASFYYLQHETAAHFAAEISDRMDVAQALDVLCGVAEYDDMPVRHNEDLVNTKFSERIAALGGWGLADAGAADDPHAKVHLLLQAHCCRAEMPMADYALDLKGALDQSSRLLQAMVDVAVQRGWLRAALSAMAVAQMLAQARWHTAHTCTALPQVSPEAARRLAAKGLSSLAALVEGAHADEPGLRRALQGAGLGARDARAAAQVCVQLPVVDVAWEVGRGGGGDGGPDRGGGAVRLDVTLQRRNKAPAKGKAFAPRFPKAREEGWWLVAGDPATNELFALKRVAPFPRRSPTYSLALPALDSLGRPTARAVLFLVSDVYLGLDQEHEVEVAAAAAAGAGAAGGYASDSSDDSFWLPAQDAAAMESAEVPADDPPGNTAE